MEGIRLATPEEVERISKESDLGPTTTVIAFPTKEETILGVLRQAAELDPVFYGNASAVKKAMFIWGVENMLRFQGVPAYYFNVPASEEAEEYRKVVVGWGAEQVSKEPEIRFKKRLS